MFNNDFYPTPKHLIGKMWGNVKNYRDVNTILEPSAGKGDIIKYINDSCGIYRKKKFSAIEIVPELRSILNDIDDVDVIHTDFLQFTGEEQFDLIIANPPFSHGAEHLLKAIDVMYSGQIVFLLNAETLKNPYSAIRKSLSLKLEQLGAEISYVSDSFLHAERTTSVEVAIVYIEIKRDLKTQLFGDDIDVVSKDDVKLEENKELVMEDEIGALVEAYNDAKKQNLEFIKFYYKNKSKLFFSIDLDGEESSKNRDIPFSTVVRNSIDDVLKKIRKAYWKRVLKLESVSKRLTVKELAKFNKSIEYQQKMEFTVDNIQSFILNLIKNYSDILGEAVEDVFEKMTTKHCYLEGYSKNTHYFDGWKTNKAFFVNKKVILPINTYDGRGMRDWNGNWKANEYELGWLSDIDKVMNYFDACPDYVSMIDALNTGFAEDESRNIESTYFKMSVFKKGTIHLTFLDEGIRRRFNVMACQRKNMLPHNYGTKGWSELNKEQKDVVEQFEGKESYNKRVNQVGFANQSLLQLEDMREV